jgi:hypothetical protein
VADTPSMLDTELVLFAAAALAGALVAAVWCRWGAARERAALQAKLQMSEMARHALLDRSDQARVQIGQLTKALADANRIARGSHAVHPPAPEPVAAEPPQDLLLQGRSPPQAFADTQVLDRERPGAAGSWSPTVKRT